MLYYNYNVGGIVLFLFFHRRRSRRNVKTRRVPPRRLRNKKFTSQMVIRRRRAERELYISTLYIYPYVDCTGVCCLLYFISSSSVFQS